MNPVVSAYVEEAATLMIQASWLLRRASSATPDWHDKAARVVDRMDSLTGYIHHPRGSFPESEKS